MNIGIVCYPTFGGSGVVATELGIALAKAGHHVHFITYKRPARLTTFHENVFYHEVASMAYPLFEYTPYESALASKLVNVCLFEKLDILHVHYAIPHAAVAFMTKQILESKGYNIPVVTTLHGTDISLVGKDPSFSPVVEFAINQSDGVTAVSQNLKNQTLKQFKIEKEIAVIYNFIDFNRFRKTDKNHFKKAIAPNNEKIILHTSNFRKVKRVGDVIRIFKNISEATPSKLLLIGDGPERQNMERLCRTIGICSEIRFLGKQDAVEDLLSIGDLFLIPSENESFGLAALEAMACEVPIISSDIGGLTEVNVHGVTGYTSKVGAVNEMSKHAIELLKNDRLHQTMSQNALKKAQSFDIKHILPQYEAFYSSLISNVEA